VHKQQLAHGFELQVVQLLQQMQILIVDVGDCCDWRPHPRQSRAISGQIALITLARCAADVSRSSRAPCAGMASRDLARISLHALAPAIGGGATDLGLLWRHSHHASFVSAAGDPLDSLVSAREIENDDDVETYIDTPTSSPHLSRL